MSDAGGTEETTDYSKLKVNDLKKLLKNRGMSIAGNKQELVERLQTSEASAEDLLDGSEVGDELVDEDLENELKFLEKDESSLIEDETVIDKNESKKDTPEKEGQEEVVEEPGSTSPTKVPVSSDNPSKTVDEKATNGAVSEEAEITNTTQQKRKISLKAENTTGSEANKKKLRAERFGAQGPTEVLAKRAERFAINSTTTSTTAVSDKSKLSHNETMKKRAERFGILSPAEAKRLHLEKLQARKLRFSSTPDTVKETPSNIATTTTVTPNVVSPGVKTTELSVEQKKQLRAQRFKTK